MSGPVAFDQRSAEKLAAMYRQVRLELANLQRSLVAPGVQRHQSVLMPGLGLAKLTEALDDDHLAAKAKKWAWSPAAEEYAATEREITLHSFLRPAGATIAADTLVIYAQIGKRREIVGLGFVFPAFTARATLDGALTGDTATISGFTVTSPPPFTTPPDPLPTSVGNPFKHRGQAGGQVLLLFDGDAEEWQVIDVEKTVVKIAVGVGGVGPLRAEGNKLQLYLTEVATEYGSDPVWEDMVPGTGCPAP